MIISMDLNASPLPEEEEEEIYSRHIDDERSAEDRIETSVETMRREREERRRRLQRENPDSGPRRLMQRSNVTSTFSRSHGKENRLPQGWLDCPSYGQNIDFLIPSKVPLGESFNDCVPPGRRYSSKQVIQHQKRQGRDIGLVIDLTNTTRYYASSDWIKQGIKHVKIPCKGRDSVPDNESVNIFCNEVDQFLSAQRNLKKFIVVHCTHGYNRTGFMIINYLMRSKTTYLTEAIQAFITARPPGIYKADYIDALYRLYHERRPQTMTCPSTPEWKRSTDLDLNGEAIPDDDDDGSTALPLHAEITESEVMTNDDVIGDTIPYDQQHTLQQFCMHMLKLGLGGRGHAQFPGSHPVSLNRDNLQLLRQRYYYLTWKADGTRYMMLLTMHGCYLIDRNFCFRRVHMRFPRRNAKEEVHKCTLVDGEMIIDRIPNTQKSERRYLIYDLMVLNGESVVERPFSERWKLIEEEVVDPRNHDRTQNAIYIYEMEPFRVRRKNFWPLTTVTKILKEFIPGLSHEADGLIFQGCDDPYVPRTHEGLLKWKYPQMNSVDFQFEVTSEGRQLLYLFERGKKKLMDGSRVAFGDVEDVSALSGKIVECFWDSDQDTWVCMRIRADKSTPNDINTYRKVMRSIKDNITEDILLDDIKEIVRLPMYADRIARAQQMYCGQRRK